MDKYEFNIKVEQIRKLVNKGDYETAMKIADSIDWKRVRNANLLSMIAEVYEKNAEYQEAKDILLLAFERAPIGKRLLFKLTDLALKEDNVNEAEAYYREFCDLAGDDPRQHLLRYMILKAKGASNEQLIHSLERYTGEELDEKWLYELAELYHQAGDEARCVQTCDQIMLMFGLGKYVDKAMELKLQYAPLTNYQMDLVENREKYEAKLRAVEQAYQMPVDVQEEEGYIREENDNPPEQIAEGDYESEPYEGEEEKPYEMPEEEQDREEPETAVVEEDMAPIAVPLETDVVAAVRQEEAEKKLAQELSRITEEAPDTSETPDTSEMEKTIILNDIKRVPDVQNSSENAAELANTQVVKLEEAVIKEALKPSIYFMIEARTPEKGLAAALDSLKQIQKETGIKHAVAKISGEKLNQRGVLSMAEKLHGKDLVVENAADMLLRTQKELLQLMLQDEEMRVILVDNPKQMEHLCKENPELTNKFQYVIQQPLAATGAAVTVTEKEQPLMKNASRDEAWEKSAAEEKKAQVKTAKAPAETGYPVAPVNAGRTMQQGEADADEEMDIDEFAQYACQYASEIDCSITGKSMLALYERIEIMEEDGIPLTRAAAEDLIEEAADRAEKPSLGKLIKGAFSSKYDKDGLLILKEEHFI